MSIMYSQDIVIDHKKTYKLNACKNKLRPRIDKYA